ncbi:hypothetical protein NA57DRAFT_75915 [Rhizodiscina lignyota]|uniref:Uncharacterized protein n=1 Tax=Rhizodiscina lignyota TaxID=1504668 RepID=A0A9P4IG41_9PEZI|nr:hypothetical protein NA57DRAFT_75915 [Rhizodiscina lignyota]
MSIPNDLPPVNRYITTHDSEGKAVFSTELSEQPPRVHMGERASFALAYTTSGSPVKLNDDADIEGYKPYLASPPGLTVSNGTVCRMVDFAPARPKGAMHRTVSIDYGVVIEGEIECLLDSGEKRIMKRGDICVQRATAHAWKNLSQDKWARMMFVLMTSDKPTVNGKELGEDVHTVEGVKKSG